MVKAYAFVADGTEETELLAVADVLIRAGVSLRIVSVGAREITSSHGIRLIADAVIGDVALDDADLLFVPGGMPGSVRLSECKPLIAALDGQLMRGKRVAAICAAPALVLGKHGLLNGKNATCFPGFEGDMSGATVTGARVVTDGNVTTARGLGCAIELGLELVGLLFDKAKADEIKSKIQF